jgi:hypothetical protein
MPVETGILTNTMINTESAQNKSYDLIDHADISPKSASKTIDTIRTHQPSYAVKIVQRIDA